MGKYRVHLSEPAENDLRDIVRYISAALASPISAGKMMDIIQQAISDLAAMPHRCPSVRDERLAMLGYHKLLVENYVIFFTVDEKAKIIDIERILFARRDWQRIL